MLLILIYSKINMICCLSVCINNNKSRSWDSQWNFESIILIEICLNSLCLNSFQFISFYHPQVNGIVQLLHRQWNLCSIILLGFRANFWDNLKWSEPPTELVYGQAIRLPGKFSKIHIILWLRIRYAQTSVIDLWSTVQSFSTKLKYLEHLIHSKRHT